MSDERPDDTTLRHEVRWIAATLPPVSEQVARVREVLAQMTPQTADYERRRIAEILPVWDKALNEGAQ